jgi:hypothetical protein
MKLSIITTSITWLLFIAGSLWLILSDLNIVPRLYIVDHYYWLVLIIFILLISGSSINHSRRLKC